MLALGVAIGTCATIALVVIPLWLYAFSLHGYHEWRNPWLMWAHAMRELPLSVRIITTR